ncbi:PQQ-dependent sugar dehydrogenase [Saccharibacillus kuerlensis]|uniref:Dehydrogenase n=1 Tax=Saccharibacillus kuerlensis TaxID=459527 RepID=A0ABQ2L763_9BACL|nr:PQQ-dependent sugar dehydrogenase [Saccharibacillus kuerlensis]GGO02831.1 dehydrogenase [Saccharibacillus kuerlensis]
MPILNTKGKALTAALLLALPVSAYAADQREVEQTMERASVLTAEASQPVLLGASVSSAAEANTTVKSSSLVDSLQGGYDAAATNLKVPWSMQFAGDTVYITQRGGGIVELKNGKQTVQEVRTKKPLRVVGEAGLTGFVLDPNFAKNKYAYIYHAYEEKGQGFNRIVKVKLMHGVWREQKELVSGIPGGRIHEGGRLAFGPDGMLYSTSGDANRREHSQDLSSLGGKVLRMTKNGNVPKDNPIKNSYVYAYGLRNSQGLAWTSSGTLYASDHGPSGAPIPGGNGVDTTGLDEINIITPGGNYGWPVIQGTETAPGMISPYYVTGAAAIAPSGIAATSDNKILVATLRGESLKEFDPITKTMTDVLTGEGRIRDVAVHNGRIYVLTNNTSGGTPGPNDDRLLILK